MNQNDLMDKIPHSMVILINDNVGQSEDIQVQLKGSNNEILLCTNSRVLIIKKGFMTGHLFGSNIFQLNYTNITSAEVKFHLLSGYFEISTGGMQNTEKNYWATNNASNPAKAPNCVSIASKFQAKRFQSASAFIMRKVDVATFPAALNRTEQDDANTEKDIATQIERLSKLFVDGLLSQEEFDAAKRKIIS